MRRQRNSNVGNESAECCHNGAGMRRPEQVNSIGTTIYTTRPTTWQRRHAGRREQTKRCNKAVTGPPRNTSSANERCVEVVAWCRFNVVVFMYVNVRPFASAHVQMNTQPDKRRGRVGVGRWWRTNNKCVAVAVWWEWLVLSHGGR